MESTCVPSREEETVVTKAEEILEQLGIDTAENKGVSAMKRAGKIAEKIGISEMTLDEINGEIREARN